MTSRPLACRSLVIEDTTTKSSRSRSRSKGETQNQRRTKMNGTEQKTSQTPYSAWLQTEILHTLQQTVSDHPGEYTFLINVQVQELYWALIVREMQAAQASLRGDNLAEAHEALLRVVDHHEPLNATWRSLLAYRAGSAERPRSTAGSRRPRRTFRPRGPEPCGAKNPGSAGRRRQR